MIRNNNQVETMRNKIIQNSKCARLHQYNQYSQYGHVSVLSSIRTGARVSIQSIPSLNSWNTAVIRMIIEPLLSTFLYVFLAGAVSGGFNGAASVATSAGFNHSLIASTLAAVMGACSISTSMTVSEALAWDRFEGTTPFVLTSAKVALPLWFGRIIALVTISLVSDAVTLFITMLVVSPSAFFVINMSVLMLLFLIVPVASTGFGIAIAAISMMMNDVYTISNALSAILPIVCGVIAPISVFPKMMQYVLYVIPVTHVTQVSRSIVDGSVNVDVSLLVILIVGALWAIVGVIIWNVGVAIQRRKGTLTNIGF